MEAGGLTGNVGLTWFQFGELGDAEMPSRKHIFRNIATDFDERIEFDAAAGGGIPPGAKAPHQIAKSLRASIAGEDSDMCEQGSFGAV
jgi:hypothetical protein